MHLTRRKFFGLTGAATAVAATGLVLPEIAHADTKALNPVWIESPNFTAGRGGAAVDKIVIHHMAGTRAATDSWFQQTEAQVSAHYGIGEGQLSQYVAEENTAWHAGDSAANRSSIGIEHSADIGRPPDDYTYNTSIELCTDLCRRYGIDPNTGILPHKQFSSTDCPGEINLQRIIDGVNAAL
ncbi:N-acetylmuramoyl-L-alanine amidase [Naumannella cuiyingiana]|uniref:N-acetylmuramoyl-L-alanine amidase n=1 Tax=Naumannella cuiyingiana TaxID=1347891 RepID=A0A7Z0D8T8_9ACTN|nr:peptidoglycan recognition family protein [Naumannella cuiyingiana]NYI70917.1 N-acetyl-anhydromuramyl-L-alanine amidase AmpD [Naumannella cuiyingiana]